MATGGEVQGQCHDSGGSEDLHQLKCQPCLEDGNLQEAMGMCVDCQDYLCQKCFDVHKVPKPCRNHQLLDREQMLHGQIQTRPNDKCTEKCPAHEDEVIKYYCTSHCLLGCSVCVTLDHKACEDVQYIPHVAKELASNEEYRKVEYQLKSALEAFKKVSENTKQDAAWLENSCSKALDSIKEYRRKVDEALSKIEAELVKIAQAIKSKEIRELAAISDKYKKAHDELQSTLEKIEAFQHANQNCSSYTEMMRTKKKLESLEAQIQEAEMDKSYRPSHIQFSANLETLDTLKHSQAFGTLSGLDRNPKVNARDVQDINVKSGTGSIVRPYTGSIENATHLRDINVKTRLDTNTCSVRGLAVLPDSRLLLADNNNTAIKAVRVQNGEVLSKLNLSSGPWDITTINKNKVAVALPTEKKVAIVTVENNNNLNIDRKLNVNGFCYGVDYRNDKLAVSFYSPSKVKVLNLQGSMLYDISSDKQGKALFSIPYYLSYGTDDTTLYVSNFNYNNVECVKMDGTVVATYTDSNLQCPLKPVLDSSGNVLVCGLRSHTVHQITEDCKKIRVLLAPANGLRRPHSICLSEDKEKLFVGMENNNNIKVYHTANRL